MESIPLHHSEIHKWPAYINRIHTFIHSIALTCMIFYRVSSSLIIPTLPWLLIFSSELLLGFIWIMKAAYGWRPVSRSVFLERLPSSNELPLPPIDVFVCTTDPIREPPLKVMNTVLSAMALDYPPGKLSVYLSDDGGSSLTLYAIREAWEFGKLWVPFRRKYEIKTSCPEAYFSAFSVNDHAGHHGFREARENIEREYDKFKERLRKAGEKGDIKYSQDHPALIEIIGFRSSGVEDSEMPCLVYVSREKKPSHSHNFKAGALNVLIRVSGIISNSPYILVLDCDMYCNDSSSARQAMCFHLDQRISSSLAFVQFPQKFGNISKNDIYDASLRYIFVVMWPGMDGLRGPILSGTCFYIKRQALYGSSTERDMDLTQLKQSFGPSNEFLKSLKRSSYNEANDNEGLISTLLQEARFVGSFTYEKNSDWGNKIGFLYDSVVEDYFTGFILHCRGWNSIFCNPQRPAFLGNATINLSDTIIQGTRWNSGLLEVFLSRYCPIIYGLGRMPLPECMCYAYFSAQPLYCFPVWCLGIVPQLCLLNGIPTYPKASSPWFILYSFVFLSILGIHLLDVLRTGGTIQIWWNEWRVWMIKSVTAYFYGSLDAVLKFFGVRKASFVPTNKAADGNEQLNRYQMGIYDFQASIMLLAPLVLLVIFNMVAFVFGVGKLILAEGWEEMLGQIFLSFYILIVNYPIIEGMLLRKDKGRIPPSTTLFSIVVSFVILFLGTHVCI